MGIFKERGKEQCGIGGQNERYTGVDKSQCCLARREEASVEEQAGKFDCCCKNQVYVLCNGERLAHTRYE